MTRLLAFLLILPACRPARGDAPLVRDSAALAARETRLADRMSRGIDSALARWVLPPELGEISGLALTGNGRLLAHTDESARIFELDYKRGVILDQFMLGGTPVLGDFEAIATAGERLFLLSSDGKVFEFREGKNGGKVPYTIHNPKLADECEFEGLTFDSASKTLVLACKNILKKKLKDFVVLYRWNPDDPDLKHITTLTVPMDQVIQGRDWKRFSPSDITVDPISGNYLIIASQERAMLSLTPDGRVLSVEAIPGDHPMAEGVALTRDGILIVSDEATRTPATLALYRRP